MTRNTVFTITILLTVAAWAAEAVGSCSTKECDIYSCVKGTGSSASEYDVATALELYSNGGGGEVTVQQPNVNLRWRVRAYENAECSPALYLTKCGCKGSKPPWQASAGKKTYCKYGS